MKPGVITTLDKLANVAEAVRTLSANKVYVGVPAEKSLRDNAGGIGNAAIGYIHENGAPEAGIPARPHLLPTIRADRDTVIIPALRQAHEAAFLGEKTKVVRVLSRMGQQVADDVKLRITEGIPPPLKDATVIARARRKQAYKNAGPKRRAAMRAATLEAGATPLLDTSQYLKSITFVLRKD